MELVSIIIAIVVTGQEDNKIKTDKMTKIWKNNSETEEAFEDDQTGQCGVSNGGIGVLKTIIVIHPLLLLYHS